MPTDEGLNYLPDPQPAAEEPAVEGADSDYRFDLPEVDTSIDTSQFASGSTTELAPPEDIDAAQIGDYTPYIADDERTVSEDATVEGRLTGLLSQNNPYIERARLEGKQYANQSGMLNTSMAAGASMGAAIDRALPIAQQDAAAYLEQSFLNQGYSNDEAKHLADATIERENLQAGLDQDTNQFNAAQSFEADKINAAEANKNNFAVLTADLQGQLAGIDNQLAMNLEALSREYAILENLDSVQGAIYTEVIAGISTILANEDKDEVAAAKINDLIDAANVELAFSNGTGTPAPADGSNGLPALPGLPEPEPEPEPAPAPAGPTPVRFPQDAANPGTHQGK